MTVLVDYFGREVTDSLAVCRRFPELAAQGMLSLRLDTPGGRYIEGLDPAASYAVLERNVAGVDPRLPQRGRSCATWSAPACRRRRSGICARSSTGRASTKVKIVASSGFGPAKCRVMAEAKAPIDVVGTGSFLPRTGPRPTPPPTSSSMTARSG